AAEAVSLELPAQRLAAWLAHGRSALDTARYVDWLSHASLGEVAARPEIAQQLDALVAERGRETEQIRRLAQWHDDVVVFDRFDDVGARNPGFVGYLLFPAAVYCVSGTRTAASIKITVGLNPWTTSPRRSPVDVGALCARFGGGGHAVVGGITLRGDELQRARDTIPQLIAELTKRR